MFASLLNKGIRGSLVFLVLIFLISAVLIYFSPVSLETNTDYGLFFNYLVNKISNKAVILSLNFVFIGLGVFLTGLILINQEIVEKSNYFSVFLFLILSIISVNPFQITPQLFTNLFILFYINKLISIYRQERVLSQIFEAAFCLSFSAFLTISSIISLPIFFITLIILRSFNWREWVISIVGIFAPLFIYEGVAYLSGYNSWYLFEAIAFYFKNLSKPIISEYYFPILFLLFVLLLISVIKSFLINFGNSVKKQRTKLLFVSVLLFNTFGFFSKGATGSSIILTYALPLSFFIGDFLYEIKQKKIVNTILTLIILCLAVIFAGQMGAI